MAQTIDRARMLRLPAVLELTGLSRSGIYRMVDAGEFPKPAKLGERVIAWPDREVHDWLDARLAER